jgi:hypothetical protein
MQQATIGHPLRDLASPDPVIRPIATAGRFIVIDRAQPTGLSMVAALDSCHSLAGWNLVHRRLAAVGLCAALLALLPSVLLSVCLLPVLLLGVRIVPR